LLSPLSLHLSLTHITIIHIIMITIILINRLFDMNIFRIFRAIHIWESTIIIIII